MSTEQIQLSVDVESEPVKEGAAAQEVTGGEQPPEEGAAQVPAAEQGERPQLPTTSASACEQRGDGGLFSSAIFLPLRSCEMTPHMRRGGIP